MIVTIVLSASEGEEGGERTSAGEKADDDEESKSSYLYTILTSY